jgi:hypothetical protein
VHTDIGSEIPKFILGTKKEYRCTAGRENKSSVVFL